jgi:ATP-binding protein involved in chromosome partitioning
MRLLSGLRGESAPSVDQDRLRAVVGRVQDPELRLSLDEAGMLERVAVDVDGRVTATVRLTTPTCPLRQRLEADVRTAALSVDGVRELRVEFTAMHEQERMRLAAHLRADHPSSLGRFGAESPTRVYAVASGKGGVGKSTVTANLAAALAARGQRVGVLDADVWGHSMPQLFGVRRAPVALKGLMLPVEAHGVALMSVGFLVDDDEPIVWRGPMLHKAIEQFLTDVHWGELDVLLIDLPPGTGDVTISLTELLPDAALLVVTTPQPAADTVAARVGRMAKDVRMPVAGVIENMSTLVCEACTHATPLFGEGGGVRVAERLGVPLLGHVPLDLGLRASGDLGVPAVISAPDSPSARELSRVAAELPTVRASLVGRPLPLSVP